ncbi:MAG: DUF1295 domain-containing protein [Holophagales bacterium]|nr:DUF1295 domain-containing protein [Holophagales bacterium]MYG29915.1 DUF1295 domain-containing protein [Holophagales bacterium]MYI80869.1 DUF1295 domain-containing protein [Holophagales bacterium]
MGTALDLYVILAILCWLTSVITREYSWVDRLWSICPPVYCLIVAFSTDFEFSRVNVMTLLVLLWGLRLTFNFARKGGYWKGGEDYRWATVRERFGPVAIQVMNATIIAPGQMLLIWWFTSPIHAAWEAGDTPLGGLDFVAAGLFLLLLIGETVADEQMWAFQQDKKRRVAAGEEVAQPFMNRGLFRICRHPNYLCEMGMWCAFYLFAVAASGEWLHWTGFGCLGLIGLVVGSIPLAESISAARYPSYPEYKASTPCLIPGLRLGKP